MTTATNDLDEAFWTRIEERPDDPLPRLLFADWCDENDWPEMAELQRWLATTGRRPFRYRGQVIWFTGREFTDEEIRPYLAHTIPVALAMGVRLTPPATRRIVTNLLVLTEWEGFYFPTQGTSEESLAAAWKRARHWSQLLYWFVPDYRPASSRDLPAELPYSYDRRTEKPSRSGYVGKLHSLVAAAAILICGKHYSDKWGAVTFCTVFAVVTVMIAVAVIGIWICYRINLRRSRKSLDDKLADR